MVRNPDDDLIDSSTMSFGDHLEELRFALFRSVLGLTVGVLLGLAVAEYVVEWIKSPLEAALQDYYIGKSINTMLAESPIDPNLEGEELKAEQQRRAEVEKFMYANRLVVEKIHVEAAEFSRLQNILAEHAGESKKPSSADDIRLTSTTTAGGKDDGGVHFLGGAPPAPGNLLVSTRVWRPIQTVVKALSVHEVFMIWMKAALVAGAVISSPYVFLQIWNFIAAGLYPHEKRYVFVYLPFSLFLFIAGAALAFYGVMKPVLAWLFSFSQRMNIDPDPRINEWMGFVLFMPLGFGISFQLPLVMLLLHRIGVFSIDVYISKWRIAILVIFIVSMVLTPADPVSMLFMAIPLTFLYFGGIGLCKWMPRGKNPFDEAYEP